MTTQMIRKQIYLSKRLDETLKRLSKKRGVSEAEIIRQALEHEASISNSLPYNHQATVTAILNFSNERLNLAETAKPYTWNRAEIYEERENRRDKPQTGQ